MCVHVCVYMCGIGGERARVEWTMGTPFRFIFLRPSVFRVLLAFFFLAGILFFSTRSQKLTWRDSKELSPPPPTQSASTAGFWRFAAQKTIATGEGTPSTRCQWNAAAHLRFHNSRSAEGGGQVRDGRRCAVNTGWRSQLAHSTHTTPHARASTQ